MVNRFAREIALDIMDSVPGANYGVLEKLLIEHLREFLEEASNGSNQ